MKLIKLIAIVFVPVLVGFLASSVYSSGILVRWKLVSSPTAEELGLFSATKNPDGYPDAIQACDYSMVEFSILSNKPNDIADCIQATYYNIDGNERISLVRDNAGIIWKWSFLSTAIKQMGNVFWPVVGLIIGVISMLIIRGSKKAKGK